MNRTDDIDAALRSLDPADRHIDPSSPRARADLEAILATDPETPALTGRPRSATRPARRVALIGGVAAALAAGLVAMPSLTGGDQAFATWTAAPAEMSAQQRPEAAADCRKNMADGAGADYLDQLAGAEIAVAESRGVWTTVVLAGPGGFSALCITDESGNWFERGMIGSVGHLSTYVAPAPRELLATDLGVGSMGGHDLSLAAGHAGSDVVGVVYRSQTHGDVAATVSHGRFALWLPGDEFDASSGVEVDVTYRDGTTATNVLTLE